MTDENKIRNEKQRCWKADLAAGGFSEEAGEQDPCSQTWHLFTGDSLH